MQLFVSNSSGFAANLDDIPVYGINWTELAFNLTAVYVGGRGLHMSAETIRPNFKPSIRAPSSPHPPELVCYVVVLGLEGACFGKLLVFSAHAVAAPFAKDNVTYHHLVVRRINAREDGLLRFGGLIDLRIAVFKDSECSISLFSAANFRPLYRLFAAGFSMPDP